MADDQAIAPEGVVRLPAREIPAPVGISPEARAVLAAPRPAAGSYPDLANKDGWRRLIASRDGLAAEANAALLPRLKVEVEQQVLAGVSFAKATPAAERRVESRHLLFDIHGGALIFGGGPQNVALSTAGMALRTGRTTWGIDYRVAPDHPYPAALDDCLAVYKALLEMKGPHEIVVSGTSAGGNLAAALMLRLKAQGLPLPAGLILITPELDLTESGDSFHTLMGLDVVLPAPLIDINRLYADGADLADPFLSPLFGDVSGFPPTFLQAGTRDIFLSNAVRMHRRLRAAGVRAELHVWEAMPHGGFGGLTPEDRELSTEMKAFLAGL